MHDHLWTFPDMARQDLNSMMKTQVQKVTNGYMCLICGRISSRLDHLKRHLKEQHMQPEYFRCPPCNQVFVNRQFYNHIRKAHPTWKDIDYKRYLLKEVEVMSQNAGNI